MTALRLNKLLLSASFLLIAGCSKHSAGEMEQPVSGKKQLTACEMVSAAEMTALLGGPVTVQPGPSNGQTSCTYMPVTGISPYAELKIEWGSGEGGMMGANLANAHEPGLADPLAGLGDQAVNMGPAVMIKRGDDLVTIVLSGVDNVIPDVKAIFALVDKRM
jgi:hypothetical protein